MLGLAMLCSIANPTQRSNSSAALECIEAAMYRKLSPNLAALQGMALHNAVLKRKAGIAAEQLVWSSGADILTWARDAFAQLRAWE